MNHPIQTPPVKPTGHAVGKDPASLVQNGSIKARDLREIIPKGTPNEWIPGPRTTGGFKYSWIHKGVKYLVHGHSPLSGAPAFSNAAVGWTVRIRIGNRWLTTAGNTVRNTVLYANETHIPLNF